MTTPSPEQQSHQRAARLRIVGLFALGGGLLGHVRAAQAIGGTFIACRDHLLGFVLLTSVAALLLLPLGRRLWRHRPEYTVLVLGLVQAAFGLLAWLTRDSMHG